MIEQPMRQVPGRICQCLVMELLALVILELLKRLRRAVLIWRFGGQWQLVLGVIESVDWKPVR